MKQIKIYGLIDPRTNKIRYIGKTNQSLETRLTSHLKENNSSRKNNWIKQLHNNNLIPIIKLIDEVDENEWEFWEKFWITFLKIAGEDLTNLTSGGEGTQGYKPSKEVIESRINHLRKKVKVFSKNGSLIKIYDSIEIAANELNVSKSHISECMSGKKGIKTVKGYVFRKMEDEFHSINHKWNTKKEILQCDENGVIIKKWNSIVEAAKALNGWPQGISRVLRKERKKYKGFIWKYYN